MYTVTPATVGTPGESNTYITVAGGLRVGVEGDAVVIPTPADPGSSRAVRGVVSFYTSNEGPDFYALFPDPQPGVPPLPVTWDPYGI